MPESHCGVRLCIREPLQGQGLEEERRRGGEEERRSRLDSPPVSQLRFRGLLHLCVYCLDAIYTEIHSRYFCLTPFVCEYNNRLQTSLADLDNLMLMRILKL